MAANEQVTPVGPGAGQAAPSVESRLANFLSVEAPADTGDDDEERADAVPAETAQQPEGQPDTGELTAEDLPDEASPAPEPGAVEVYEFEAAGEHLKVSRDEVIKLAQQGHDYTRKTMALAEQAKAMNERLQRVTAIEQVHPQLQNAHAQVRALEAQLGQYQRVDWVALATSDPLEYSKVRAQYDVLVQSYQGAAGQFQQMKGAVDAQTKALRADRLRSEADALTQRIPAWTDQTRAEKEKADVRSFLIAKGAAPEEVDQLETSLAVEVAYMAMKYDQLLKAKAGKVKLLQTAPPVTRPGAAPNRDAARADKETEMRTRLKKSGGVDDAAALLLARMR
jgi:flagellar motor switch/type III secretory pathway protein FliN